jgi:hypothetical protein
VLAAITGNRTALGTGMTPGAAIGGAMRHEIRERIVLANQPSQFGKRIFGPAHAGSGRLRLRNTLGSRRPKSAVVGH